MIGFLVPHPPLIVPGVGSGDEIPATREAYNKAAAEATAYEPDTYVIISPHSAMYADYIHISPGSSAKGDLGNFRASDIKFQVDYDEMLAGKIASCARQAGIPAGFDGERDSDLDHGTMIPLYFFDAPRIVRISISGLSFSEHHSFGMCIADAAEVLGRKICIIASGDMSHKLKADGPYGFDRHGPEHDEYVRNCIEKGNFSKLMEIEPELCEKAAECGTRTIMMLIGAFKGRPIKSELLCYEGPYGVGYMTAAFREAGDA